LDQAIAAIDDKLIEAVKADERARRLMTIPGVGPVIATAVAATVGEVASFASAREFAAFLGLTPRQHSSGGRSAPDASRKWATDICVLISTEN
jgi:transposase